MKYGPWKIWNGGECPVSFDKLVSVQLAENTRAEVEKSPLNGHASGWDWNEEGGGAIIAYREVIEPKRETQVHQVEIDLCEEGLWQPVTITLDLEGGQIVGGTIKPGVSE